MFSILLEHSIGFPWLPTANPPEAMWSTGGSASASWPDATSMTSMCCSPGDCGWRPSAQRKKGAHSWFTPPNGKHTTRNHCLVGHLLYMYLRLFSRGCSILVGWDPMALHIIITTLFAPCCHHPVATCRGTCQKDDEGCTHYAVTASVQHSLSKTACHLQTGWRHDTDQLKRVHVESCGIMQHRWFYHIYEMRDFPPNPCNIMQLL